MADETISVLLTVTGAQGAPRLPLSISKAVSASKLRQLVSEETKIPLASLKLIFRGRLISNDDSKEAVTEYKLEEGSVLHCMGKPASAAAAASAAAPTATTNLLPPQPAAAAAATPTFTLPTAPPAAAAAADPLQAALLQLRSSCSPPDYSTAVSTLDKILSNIIANPMEEKYRKVKKQNAAFQRRLGSKTGGDAAMKAAGFVTQQDNGEDVYMMQASPEAWPKLQATKKAVEAAAQQAQTAAANNQPNNNMAAAAPAQMPGGLPGFGGMGGMPGFGGMGSGGMGAPPSPEQLQAVMQNPMFQNMLRNHPMGQQLMDNPEMLAQVSQMMQDPNAIRQMQAMMQNPQMQAMMQNPEAMRQQMQQAAAIMQQQQQQPQQPAAGGGAAGANNTMPSFFPPAQQQQQQAPSNNNNNQGQGSGGGGSDEQMTEEEMIAEAVRRSLQDGS